VTVHVDTLALSVKGEGAGTGQLAVRRGDEDRTIDFDRLLVATGRAPRSEGLNLAGAGARTDERGAVIVDGRLRTTARHICAVGDVTGALPVTHVAAYHARVAVVNALFAGRRSVSYDAVPWVTFTDPEVGRVGLTEQEARDRWGDRVVATSFEYAELDRAITAGVPYGFAKLVGDGNGRLVGATVAAVGGGEAVAELAAWISTHARIDRVSQTVHAYPTFAEGPARAADQYLRDKLARPRMQALTKTALSMLRALDSAS
jgi:pyruvate/2-oxoglutarate dehydrogenase complex dihydrolipoamide dehydrogenase (E3) component